MELASLGRVLFAFVFVIGLMLTLAWLFRKFGLEKRFQHSGAGEDGRPLSVEQTLYLDPKRRLMVIGHGERKHVLLLGATQDLLLESYDGTAKDLNAKQTSDKIV